MVSDAIPFVSQTCEAGGRASGPTVPAGNAVLKCGLLAGLEIAAGTIEENNRRRIDYSGAPAQFDDVLTQAADLEEAPAWWVRPRSAHSKPGGAKRRNVRF